MDGLLLSKITILLSVALAAASILRRSAAARHRLWTALFAALLALPMLTLRLPALHVPMPETWTAPSDTGNALRDASAIVARERVINTRAPDERLAIEPVRSQRGATIKLASILPIVWAAGVTVTLASLIMSLLGARRLKLAAMTLDDPVWRDAAARIATHFGTRRVPRLLVSDCVGSPMAGGLWRPVIFLPASIEAWTPERRDVVLAHEIAHLAAVDPLRHLLARVAIALYWFHPFLWIAAWQASVAREQACDEAVLALGMRPSAYARVLVELAESIDPPFTDVVALPMVERSLLERRLMTILNSETHPMNPRRAWTPAVVLAALTLPLAAAQPVVLPVRETLAASTVVEMAAPGQTAQIPSRSDVACWLDGPNSSSMRVDGSERLIQQTFGDVQICMLAVDAGERVADERPSQWMRRARRVLIETRQGASVQRLEIVRATGSAEQVSWRVGDAVRAFDAAAERWRDRATELLDTAWELAVLRGNVSSLRGEISSVRGRESALRGEISSLRGEVSAMRGRSSSLRGDESALQGQISSIRGHISALRGAISAERGAISTVNASRSSATASENAQIAARIKRHEAEIAGIEQAIREYNADARIAEVEKAIVALRAAARSAQIENEITAFDLAGKVAAVERRIAELNVERKVEAIERQIESLDADRRNRQLQERRDEALRQLEAALRAIR